jgi:hypothetical protein
MHYKQATSRLSSGIPIYLSVTDLTHLTPFRSPFVLAVWGLVAGTSPSLTFLCCLQVILTTWSLVDRVPGLSDYGVVNSRARPYKPVFASL